MILLTIIICFAIIHILARIIAFIINSILDNISAVTDNDNDNKTVEKEQTNQKRKRPYIYWVVCAILIVIWLVYPAYQSNKQYIESEVKKKHLERIESMGASSPTTSESTATSQAHSSYRSPNERSYRWIYDADTGIGYHSGESQCSILSLHKHSMGSNNPHWVTFMITKYDSGSVRLIISDGIYEHIANHQTVGIDFDHANSLSLSSEKSGVKLMMYTNSEFISRMKASTRMSMNVRLDNQTSETLEFDLSNFGTQCPY